MSEMDTKIDSRLTAIETRVEEVALARSKPPTPRKTSNADGVNYNDLYLNTPRDQSKLPDFKKEIKGLEFMLEAH